jgi:hypothetical protein
VRVVHRGNCTTGQAANQPAVGVCLLGSAYGVAADATGNLLIAANRGVQLVDASSGILTTVAGRTDIFWI